MRSAIAAGAYLVVLSSLGCDSGPTPPPIVPARGTVTLNGAPLAKAQVRFFPKMSLTADYVAGGVTDEQGRFELTCHGQPGACATENYVTVAEMDIPPELLGENAQDRLAVYLRTLKNRPIPAVYGTPSQSPLSATVVEGQEEYTFELRR